MYKKVNYEYVMENILFVKEKNKECKYDETQKILSRCQSGFNYLEGKCVEPKKTCSDTRKTSSDKIKSSSK